MKTAAYKYDCATCLKEARPYSILVRKKNTSVKYRRNANGKIICTYCYNDLIANMHGSRNRNSSVKSGETKSMTYHQQGTFQKEEVARTLRKPSKESVLYALDNDLDIPMPTLVYPNGIEFDLNVLKKFCEMKIDDFCNIEGAYSIDCKQDGNAVYIDRGSKILAVAHRDFVCKDFHFTWHNTNTNDFVFTPVLDDRLGCFIILDVLPKMGFNFDILLSEGEESGRSTAAYFGGPGDKRKYNFIVEFDRKDDDVVFYQFEIPEWEKAWKNAGATIGIGSFSDIAVLEHLERCAVNIGCGYADYHGPKANVNLNMLYRQLMVFKNFMETNENIEFLFDKEKSKKKGIHGGRSPRGFYSGGSNYNTGKNYTPTKFGATASSKQTDLSDVKNAQVFNEKDVIELNGQRYVCFFDEDDALSQLEEQEKKKVQKKTEKRIVFASPAPDDPEKITESLLKQCNNCETEVQSNLLFGAQADLCETCFNSFFNSDRIV